MPGDHELADVIIDAIDTINAQGYKTVHVTVDRALRKTARLKPTPRMVTLVNWLRKSGPIPNEVHYGINWQTLGGCMTRELVERYTDSAGKKWIRVTV